MHRRDLEILGYATGTAEEPRDTKRHIARRNLKVLGYATHHTHTQLKDRNGTKFCAMERTKQKPSSSSTLLYSLSHEQ